MEGSFLDPLTYFYFDRKDQCWGFWTRNKSELHRINTNIKPYLQFSTEQKLSFKLKPRASQERSEAIIILHYIIKLQKNASQKVI